jgi:hypothetical protein
MQITMAELVLPPIKKREIDYTYINLWEYTIRTIGSYINDTPENVIKCQQLGISYKRITNYNKQYLAIDHNSINNLLTENNIDAINFIIINEDNKFFLGALLSQACKLTINAEMIRCILSHDPELNTSCLKYAVINTPEIAELILDYANDQNIIGSLEDMVLYAAASDNLPVLKMLFERFEADYRNIFRKYTEYAVYDSINNRAFVTARFLVQKIKVNFIQFIKSLINTNDIKCLENLIEFIPDNDYEFNENELKSMIICYSDKIRPILEKLIM